MREAWSKYGCVGMVVYLSMQTIVERGFVKYFVAAIVFLTVASVATFAFAADTGGLVTCTGPDCDFCTFIAMVERVGQFIVGLLIILSVIMLAWTGIQLAAAAAGGNADAHKILKERPLNIVIGFLLIIAAWTIVDTVIKALVDPDEFSFDLLNPRESASDLCKTRAITGAADTGVSGQNSGFQGQIGN